MDRVGIADDTFVMYTTDNGPHMNSWPDGACRRFAMRRTRTGRAPIGYRHGPWPGKIKAGPISNQIVGHLDRLPTFWPSPAIPR